MEIKDCAESVGDMQRPIVPLEYCHDLDSVACSALFAKVQQTYVDNLKM